MKFKVAFQATLIALIALGLSACPNHSKSKSGGTVKRVKGDPAVFIRDTDLNGLRALPLSTSAVSNEWSFDLSGFEEAEAVTDTDQMVKDQTPDESKSKAQNSKIIARVSDDQWIFEGRHGSEELRFVFRRHPQGWLLNDFKIGKYVFTAGSANMAIVHTSYTEDLRAFSLLIHDKTPGKRAVAGLTFVRWQPLIKVLGNTAYEYLFGKGVKVGWKKGKELKLLVCGNIPAVLPQIVQQEADKWAKALGERLMLSTSTRPSCPPFSDLNTRTFTFPSEWIEIVGDSGVSAWTQPIAGEGRGEILDADIFYLVGEMQESLALRGHKNSVFSPEIIGNPSIQRTISTTALHEIGHLLGLHHQFNPSIESIMSYSDKVEAKLYDYDVKAVQHLYDN